MTQTTAELTIAEMTARGEQHARAGKMCTPFDCQAIDAELFAAMKGQANRVQQARWYATMRGAFNAGWQSAYFSMVGAAE